MGMCNYVSTECGSEISKETCEFWDKVSECPIKFSDKEIKEDTYIKIFGEEY